MGMTNTQAIFFSFVRFKITFIGEGTPRAYIKMQTMFPRGRLRNIWAAMIDHMPAAAFTNLTDESMWCLLDSAWPWLRLDVRNIGIYIRFLAYLFQLRIGNFLRERFCVVGGLSNHNSNRSYWFSFAMSHSSWHLMKRLRFESFARSVQQPGGVGYYLPVQ